MMKTQRHLLPLLLLLAACGTVKKTTQPATTTASVTTPAPVTPAAKPANGIYAPGAEELAAIQVQSKAVTMEQLQEGYVLYTKGACVSCHGAMSIYQRSEVQWKTIIASMAVRARITEAQKEAVYQYVLAIKATQPK